MPIGMSHTLCLALEVVTGRHAEDELRELPLFKEWREETGNKNKRPWNEVQKRRKSERSVVKKRVSLPLAAYSAYRESAFVCHSETGELIVNESEIRRELRMQNLYRYRTLGKDTIRPLGVYKTAKELEEMMEGAAVENAPQDETNSERNLAEDELQQEMLPPHQNEISNIVIDSLPVHVDVDLDQDIPDADSGIDSYDYDEDHEDIEVDEQHISASDALRARSGLSVGQLNEIPRLEGLSDILSIETIAQPAYNQENLGSEQNEIDDENEEDFEPGFGHSPAEPSSLSDNEYRRSK
ncbi:LAMI_0F03488g1_1 [Lachancea mirantina]|uniref:LAMI_0F03488g1_1 n=1 Tax=Lachancea mirantina TaxID=1230905 RepID=A0A1G4JXH0_9SACH|nr:LAMI_0F03488g1_1 [Lachancea mirantina]